MGLKLGIVGLPNVGKSTLFNALTQSTVSAENYPFCTIEPNIGVVALPDPRIKQLATIAESAKTIPAIIEFIDIAGLIKGAAQGDGLGNKFLANIREADAILQIVRCFDNDDIIHVTSKIDPIDDINTINTELCLADQQTIEKLLLKTAKSRRSDNKIKDHQKLFEKLLAQLDQGLPIRSLALSSDEKAAIKEFCLLTEKPTLYVANIEENNKGATLWLQKIKTLASQEGSQVIAICAAVEKEISQLQEAEQQEFLHALGMQEPGLNYVVRASYQLLNLQTFFTAGPKETRAWTIPIGTVAKKAAGTIHTDFERGFIRAEVISFDDYIKYSGELGAKNAGKLRSEGKDYTVEDGDVILFRFNV